jgi:hypothetical protein
MVKKGEKETGTKVTNYGSQTRHSKLHLKPNNSVLLHSTNAYCF